MSVDSLKSIFDVAAVVLLFLTFAAGFGVLITGNIIDGQQKEKLRQFDLDLTSAKSDLTKAQTDLAKAQKDASDAQAGNKQLGIGLANAKSETEQHEKELLAEQRKTAEAQKQAAEVQLALRRAVEAAAASRRIFMGNRNGDEAIRRAKFKELEKYSDTPAIILFVSDDEAKILALDIGNALLHCNWKSVAVEDLSSTSIPSGFIEEGVQVRTMLPMNPADISVPPPGTQPPPVVQALIELLGLDLNPPVGAIGGVNWGPDGFIHGKHPVGLIRYGFKIPGNGVVITVGRKPTERYFWAIPDLKPAAIPKK